MRTLLKLARSRILRGVRRVGLVACGMSGPLASLLSGCGSDDLYIGAFELHDADLSDALEIPGEGGIAPDGAILDATPDLFVPTDGALGPSDGGASDGGGFEGGADASPNDL